MKFLVVSDNHGDREILQELVDHYQGKVDAMFHLGDSELKGDDEIWQFFTEHVGGNCDFDPLYKNSAVVKLNGETIFLSHGHLTGVRSGLDKLYYAAKENGATIALFGHTHELGCGYEDGILFVNPGSISIPKGRYLFKSYAIIEVLEDRYIVTYYQRDFTEIPNLKWTVKKS